MTEIQERPSIKWAYLQTGQCEVLYQLKPLWLAIANSEYQLMLQKAGITCSMSRRANCWDNAVAESFFGTLKIELIHPRIFSNRVIAKTIIAEWIEVFYNRQRLHSTIGYLSPFQFEDHYWSTLE